MQWIILAAVSLPEPVGQITAERIRTKVFGKTERVLWNKFIMAAKLNISVPDHKTNRQIYSKQGSRSFLHINASVMSVVLHI